jgi:protein-disulfide isomerase
VGQIVPEHERVRRSEPTSTYGSSVAPTKPRLSALSTRIITIFVVTGFTASVVALVQHYLSLVGGLTGEAARAYLSATGSLVGVPIALVGVLWFAVILVLHTARAPASSGVLESLTEANLSGYVFALSSIALPVAIYLAYQLLFVQRALCVPCITACLAACALYWMAGTLPAPRIATVPQRALEDLRKWVQKPVFLMVTILVLVASLGIVTMFRRAIEARQSHFVPDPAVDVSSEKGRKAFAQLYNALPRLTRPELFSQEGVYVVEFSDYQCPPCRKAFFDYRDGLKRHAAGSSELVQFVRMDYPLDPSCNDYVSAPAHPAACEAAIAVRLARRRGRAEAMEEWLFNNQDTLTAATVRSAAQRVGFVGPSEIQGERVNMLTLIRRDIDLAHQLSVRGTPTVFVNGVRLGRTAWPYVEAAIDFELSRLAKRTDVPGSSGSVPIPGHTSP